MPSHDTDQRATRRLGEDPPDVRWLQVAAAEAGRCPPSPAAFAVGAVIVGADGREIARGHSREGDDPVVHAEEAALAKVTDRSSLAGATLYSTLEPCGDRASRPVSCAAHIATSPIRRVVFGHREPDTFVDRPRGVAVLEAAGVTVVHLEGVVAPPDGPSPPGSAAQPSA